MSLFKLVGEVFVDTSQADKNLKSVGTEALNSAKKFQKMGKNIQNIGGKISAAGQKLTTTLTLPLVGIGVAGVKTAADFESAMSQVQATMGITSDATSKLNGETVNTMGALQDLAKEMGTSTAWSAKECADAINYLALAGYDTQQIYDVLPNVLSVASAGNMDLAAASDMVTDAMSAMGMSSQDANMFVDQLAKTSSSSNTSVEQLGQALLTVGGTAKNLNGGISEANAALGVLANNGIKGAEGGTKLRNVILAMTPTTKDAAAAWESLGMSAYDAEGNMRPLNDVFMELRERTADMSDEKRTKIFSKMFNKADLKAVEAMLKDAGDGWTELEGKIVDSAGAAEQMADTQLNNLNGQLTLLKSALEGAAISIGEQLMPMVKGAAEFVQGLVDKFNALDDSTKQNIVKIGMLVAAIGPALMIIGSVVSGIGSVIAVAGTMWSVLSAGGSIMSALTLAFGATNIAAVAIVAGIAAVIAIGVALYKNWDKIKAKAGELANAFKQKWDQVKTVTKQKFEQVKQVMGTVMDAAKSTVSQKLNNIKAAYTSHGGGVKGVVAAYMEAVKGYYTAGYTFIDTLTGGKLSAMTGTVKEKMNEAKAAFDEKLTEIKNSFGEKLSGITGKASEIVGKVKSIFSGKIEFPHIKIPHISVSGGRAPYGLFGQGEKPKFDVQYYKKAMTTPQLLDRATIFGAMGSSLLAGGEAGTEVVSGASKLMDMIRSAVDGGNMEVLYAILDEIRAIRGELFRDIMAALENHEFKLNDREIARLVKKYA